MYVTKIVLLIKTILSLLKIFLRIKYVNKSFDKTFKQILKFCKEL